MDPLLGPAQPEPEPVSGSSDIPGITTTISGITTQPGEGSAQTILDAWLQQLQTDQTEEPVVESRLDIDSLFSGELEFDLDFLTELSSLKGAGSGDGGVTLQELSQDLELGLFCPPGTSLDPEPVDLGALSGPELFPEQPPPASTQPETTSTRPGPAAALESTAARPVASERSGSGSGSGSAPPRPPPVASISVVTNKQRGKTVITISTPRGRQSFVLPTADLTQASRVLRALQQKRRRNRACAAAAAAKAELKDAVKKEEDDSVKSPAASSRRRSGEGPGKRKKSHSDAKDDDDPVMSEALRQLGVDLTQLEMDRDGESKAVTCPEPGCDMTTINMFKLKVHILQHWNYKPYKCSEEGCKWEFFERGKLNRHEATHTQASLKCVEPGCPAAFRTRTNLQRHRLRIHGLSTPAPPPPPSQPAPAPQTESAVQHTEGADEPADPLTPAQFRCTFCDRMFKMAAGLKRHLNWHEKQCVSACTYPGCGFTAPGLQQLKLHERRHAEKQYRCTYPECSWAFESNAKLKRHLSQHTGRRNFRCPYIGCEKSYRRMEYLSSHIRLHLGRYYQCPQKGCRLRFTHQFSLATHIRSAHDVPSTVADPVSSDAASVTCPMCDARFKSEIYRQIHLQDVHGTSSSKLLQSPSSSRDEEEFDARKKKSKFNPESLNWVEDGDPVVVDDGQTYTVYVPFEVETDSGPSEVLVKCDVTEDECRRLGIELGPEAGSSEAEQPPVAYDHVLAESNSAKDTARELRRMGIGVLPAGLRRTGHSGCARTDITSCHLAVRRSRPRPRRPPTGRQRRPGGWPRKHADRAGAADVPSPYDPGLVIEPGQLCQTVLEEPPSLLCDSDLLGSVHDQLQHSTINLSDLT